MTFNLSDTASQTPNADALSQPAPGIALWLCRLDRPPSEIDALARSLSQEEYARATRFGTDGLRRRWIAGRATLRQLLGQTLGIEARAVQLRRGDRGRPELAGTRNLDFNISHTEGIALMGIAYPMPPQWRIGVDIEYASRRVNADRLALKFLTANERAVSSRLSSEQRRLRFLRLWTCKEAMSKATGDALSAPFGRMDVSVEESPQLLDGPAPYRPEGWTLHAAAAPAEFIATVAMWRGP
jgi:4'-phosphopantetheinyl transferase